MITKAVPASRARKADRPDLATVSQSLRPAVEDLIVSRSHVLLEGEPGVGKHFIAWIIHTRSPVSAEGMFHVVSPQMGDDELKVLLFGEDRKRVEGILGKRVPRIDPTATLLIKHISGFSLINQTRLARFLIETHIRQHNGEPAARIIISTRVSRETLVGQKMVTSSLDEYIRQFRRLVIPPLRDRRQDIPGLVEAILDELSTERDNGHPPSVDPETMDNLRQADWMDNVRELKFKLQEALRTSAGAAVISLSRLMDERRLVDELVDSIQSARRGSLDDTLDELEKAFVQRALVACDFDLTRTSRLIGMNEQNLRYRMNKHGLRLPPKKP
jgi:two-component system response regulator PilR (NtrC family)